jgi:hypothetical protein
MLNWRDHMSEATVVVLVVGAGWLSLMWRFEQLRRQLKAVCEALKIEIAHSAGNEERANETPPGVERKSGGTEEGRPTIFDRLGVLGRRRICLLVVHPTVALSNAWRRADP